MTSPLDIKDDTDTGVGGRGGMLGADIPVEFQPQRSTRRGGGGAAI